MKKKIKEEDLKISPDFSEQLIHSEHDKGIYHPVTERGEATCEVKCMTTINIATCEIDCFPTSDAAWDSDCKTVIEGYTCKCDDDDRDTKSQQDGTGSLCISVILCKPTEKNCAMSEKVCEGPTKYQGCVESVDNCVSTACINPSVEYCFQSEINCNSENMDDGCAITGDVCQTNILCGAPSVNVCTNPDE